MIQSYLHHIERKSDLPALHSAFLKEALSRLQIDERIVAVAAGGSFLTGGMDEYSDLDLVIAVSPAAVQQIMQERHQIAATLGSLLAAFTGEHVGEPRLLICLYGPPLLHVDLKFVSLSDAAHRVEDPIVLWERDGQFTTVLSRAEAVYPTPDLQWIEDRFWTWVHYTAAKIGRGELLEAHDSLAVLRLLVLGPLALLAQGARPSGVRKVETQAQPYLEDLIRTTASYDSLNQSTRHWYSTKHRERAQTVRSERSRASGKVEERDYSRLLAFDFAALRSGRTERVATGSEEVYESSVVRFSVCHGVTSGRHFVS